MTMTTSKTSTKSKQSHKEEIKPAELTNAVKDAVKDLKNYEKLVKSASPQKGKASGQIGGGIMDTFKGPMMAAKIIIIMGILIASYIKHYKENLNAENNVNKKTIYANNEKGVVSTTNNFLSMIEKDYIMKKIAYDVAIKTGYKLPYYVIKDLLEIIHKTSSKSGHSIYQLMQSSYNLIKTIPELLISKGNIMNRIEKTNKYIFNIYDEIKSSLQSRGILKDPNQGAIVPYVKMPLYKIKN